MKNGTNSPRPSIESLGAFAGFIVEFLTKTLSASQLKYLLRHKKYLKEKLNEVFLLVENLPLYIEWEDFYEEMTLSQNIDLSQVVIPTKPTDGKWRLLIIMEGLTPNIVYDEMWPFKKLEYFNNDIDDRIISFRTPEKTSYAIWVRDQIGPDKEFDYSQTIAQLDPDMKVGITLLEMMVFEAKYFSENRKHLYGLTICSGSRTSNDKDDSIPSVETRDDGWIELGWYGPDSKTGIRRVL